MARTRVAQITRWLDGANGTRRTRHFGGATPHICARGSDAGAGVAPIHQAYGSEGARGTHAVRALPLFTCGANTSVAAIRGICGGARSASGRHHCALPLCGGSANAGIEAIVCDLDAAGNTRRCAGIFSTGPAAAFCACAKVATIIRRFCGACCAQWQCTGVLRARPRAICSAGAGVAIVARRLGRASGAGCRTDFARACPGTVSAARAGVAAIAGGDFRPSIAAVCPTFDAYSYYSTTTRGRNDTPTHHKTLQCAAHEVLRYGSVRLLDGGWWQATRGYHEIGNEVHFWGTLRLRLGRTSD